MLVCVFGLSLHTIYTQVSTNELHAFDSPNMLPLATVAIGTTVNWNLVRKPPVEPGELLTHFSNDIAILRIFPGPCTTIRQILAPPLKGLILQTFGAGNAPDENKDLMEAPQTALK
jgi:L-asparaginase/Glu-tRNA(Gln) amidotransferase subunit D